MKNFNNGENTSHNCIQKLESNNLFELAGLCIDVKSKQKNNISTKNSDKKPISHNLFNLNDIENVENITLQNSKSVLENSIQNSETISNINFLEKETTVLCSIVNNKMDIYDAYYGENYYNTKYKQLTTEKIMHKCGKIVHAPIPGENSEEIKLCKLLQEHIIGILDGNGNHIKYDKIEIKYELRYASNKFSKVLYIDNEPLSSKQLKIEKYKVIFKCRCGREQTILVYKYFVKKKICCRHCIQDARYEENYVPANYKGKRPEDKVNHVRVNKILRFEDMSDDFKNDYATKHMTEEDFF